MIRQHCSDCLRISGAIKCSFLDTWPFCFIEVFTFYSEELFKLFFFMIKRQREYSVPEFVCLLGEITASISDLHVIYLTAFIF